MDNNTKMVKMAMIAGASKAIRYKEKNPKASESEVLQHISDNASAILKEMDKDL